MSTSTSAYPLDCQVQVHPFWYVGNIQPRSKSESESDRSILESLSLVPNLIDYPPPLFFNLAIAASIAGGIAVHIHIQKRRKEGRVVNGLVQNVLAKLSDQAHYHYVDPLAYPEPFLPQLHLRDALLADVHSSVRRQEIWDKVQAVVERNANVRASSQEVRGELYRVWEWVGPSGVLMGQQHGAGSAGKASGVSVHSHYNLRHHNHPDPTHTGYNLRHNHPDPTHSQDCEDHGAMRGRSTRATPKVPPRTGPHGSFFGMRRQDSEYLNPENSLYPSLSQEEYQSRTHQ